MEESNVKVFETADLGFAAYLKMKEVELKEIGKNDKRYKFVFELNEDLIEKLKVEFVNSESYKFDSNIRILKLMIKSSRVNG